jgi:uncharacterized membrane protein
VADARGDRLRGRRPAQTVVRVLMGVALVGAGVAHLTVARDDFQAQVPRFVPLDPDVTVLASGVVEIALGTALVVARRRRTLVGAVAAAFFVAVFPGNVAQWVHGRDAFGLDTDAARLGRLFFQPLLVAGALWSTGAGHTLLARLRARRSR